MSTKTSKIAKKPFLASTNKHARVLKFHDLAIFLILGGENYSTKWNTCELICIQITKAQNIVQSYHSFYNPWNEKFWGEMKRILSFLRNFKKVRSEEILRDFREKSQQDFRGFFLFSSTFSLSSNEKSMFFPDYSKDWSFF